MATLENVLGSSFSPDLAQTLQNVRAAGKERATQTQATEQQRLAGVAGGQGTAQEKQAALVQLTAMNAPLGREVNAIIQSGDKRQAQALLQQKEKGVRNALLVKGATSLDGKRRELNEWAKRIAAEPDSPNKGQRLQSVMDLKNLGLDQLNVEIQRRENAGKSIDTLFKEQAADIQAEKVQGARDANRMLSLPENEQFPALIALEQKAISEGDQDEANSIRQIRNTPFAKRQTILQDAANQVPAAKPISVAKGATLIDPDTRQPIFTAPTAAAEGSGIKKIDPSLYTGPSLNKFNKSNSFEDLELSEEGRQKIFGGGGVKLGQGGTQKMPNGKIVAWQNVFSADGTLTTKTANLDGTPIKAGTDETAKEERAAEIKAAVEEKSKVTATTKAFALFNSAELSEGLIETYQKALVSLERGGTVDKLQSLFPTLTDESLSLEQSKAEVGLQILGTPAFAGPKSDKDIEVAFDVALPRLSNEGAKQWITRKIAQLRRQRKHMLGKAKLLSAPGMSFNKFLGDEEIRSEKFLSESEGGGAFQGATAPGPAAQEPGQVGRFKVRIK